MSHNWFAQNAAQYAQYRPQYPASLAEYLSRLTVNELAVDIGCGTGQLTVLLAQHFAVVKGFDPSVDQLKQAVQQPNINYQCAHAELLPLNDHCANLITAAQAAHWFDLPTFYQEVRRVAAPDAILALISYGVLAIEGEVGSRFNQFYLDEIGPYWPPERKQVDDGYRALEFPFSELPAPCLNIELEWNLSALLGYIHTWSATRSALDNGQTQLLERFAQELQTLWGEPSRTRLMRWPINLRVGRVAS